MNMAQLVVRNLSDDLVKALKQRAAKARFWNQRRWSDADEVPDAV